MNSKPIFSKYAAVCSLFVLSLPLNIRGEEMKCFEKREQGVRFGVLHSLDSANIKTETDPDAEIYADAIFQTLTQTDPNHKGLQGNIAKSWSSNKDNTEFIFNLVNDRVFHNGKNVTSQDVAYTFARVCWNFGGSLFILGCDKGKQGVYPEGIKVLDQFSIKFTLSRPNPHFIKNASMMGYVIIPKDNDPDVDPIGSGPMKVKYLKKGKELCLQKFDGYTGNYPATIDYISVGLFRTTKEIMDAFKEGKLDISRIPSSGFYVKDLPEGASFILHRDRGTVQLALDDYNPVFKKLENRKVLSALFFDVAQDKKNLYFNEEFSPSYIPKDRLPLPYYNRELPKLSLKQCQKLGREVKKPLKIMLSTSFFTPEFITELKKSFEKCGIAYDLKVITSKDYAEFRYALANSRYDITYYGRVPVTTQEVVYAYTKEGKSELDHKRFPNSSYAKRYVPAIYNPDPIEARTSFAKIISEMEEDYDIIPLFNHRAIFLYRKDLIIPDYTAPNLTNLAPTGLLDLEQFSWRKK